MNRPLLFFVFLMSISPDIVEGARCKKSSLGWWTCSPCGKGSRCHYCSWCTGYCVNRPSGKTPDELVVALYKLPFLEMFNDIEVLLNNDGLSQMDVLALYKTISDVTREDCEVCNNNPELNDLSIFAAKVRKELKKKIENLPKFKQISSN